MMENQNITIKKQLKISIPIAFESLINVLMTLIDTLVISTLGTKQLGAIGAMAVIINLMQMSIQTINVTNNSLIAKSIGEKDNIKVKLTSGNSILMSIIISAITIIIVYILKPTFPALFNVDSICNKYLIIRLIGFLQSSIVTILSGHQRTIGQQGNILKLRIIAVILNLIFDIFAVNLGYGIEGVAWATVIIDTILAIYLLIKSNKTVTYRYDKIISKNIFNLFKWNFVERITTRVDNFIFNILVSRMGEIEYAVHIILIQIRDIVDSFIQGFGDGITISVGIASGNKIKEYMNQVQQIAKKIIKYASIVIPVVTIIISIIIMKISLKNYNEQIIFYEVLPLIVLGIYLSTSGTYYYANLRGMRDFKFLAQRNFLSSLIKIIVAIILAYTSLGIFGVWIAYLVYCFIQKYMSKKRFLEYSTIGNVCKNTEIWN